MKTRRSRLITVISVFILTLVIIISRLFYLYFEDSGFLQNKGKLKLITSRKILSIRGQILDQNNNPLAVTVMQYDLYGCLLYTSPSPRDQRGSRMASSA